MLYLVKRNACCYAKLSTFGNLKPPFRARETEFIPDLTQAYNQYVTQNLINKQFEKSLYFYRGFIPFAYLGIMNLVKMQISLLK